MRDTIDFGIDLGTTNSAIAVADGENVSVLKSESDREITPSAVWIPKRDHIYVGDRAREKVEKDPDNAVAEFKLAMGLADVGTHFQKAGVTLTPQQLSAEVLKSLRGSAQLRGKGLPDCAVITVPAGFTLNQNQATIEAAELAGLGTACPLVPEPTAAAIAYGLRDGVEGGYWMVFDFGGGTFDAAVVSKQDGELRMRGHAGDNQLGGKLIDWALVERVLAPCASEALGLTEFRRGNLRWRQNFAALKGAAEQAKIALSVQESTDVMVELLDEHGSEETFELTVTRAELDALAEPFYLRAINFCRAALTKAALDESDIDRLLLVGGTTLAPGLRERLADPRHGLAIEVDISLDPTTVVAQGAAIYASTVRRPVSSTPEPVAAGEYTVSLHYEPRVSMPVTTVAGTLHASSTVDWSGYGVTISNPDGQPAFRSARIAVNAKGAFASEIHLDPHRTSRFTVELTDRTGAALPLSHNTFSITHSGSEIGALTLGHSLGIQLHDGVFAPLLPKGTPLPKSATESFVTAAALRRTHVRELIRIPLVQGERRRAERNQQVGMLVIRPRDLSLDLPRGSEVEVTFTVTTSNLLTAVADVPLLDAQFEADIDFSGTRAPAVEVLDVMLLDVQQRMHTVRPEAIDSPDAQRLLDKLDQEDAMGVAREQVRAAAVDPSAAKYAEDRLRDIQADLDDIEDTLRFAELAQDLQDLMNDAERLVDEVGSRADRQELTTLTGRARGAIRSQEAAAVRTETDQLVEFVVELERRSPDWPVKVFYALVRRVPPSSGADALANEGKRAAARGDVQALTSVNRRMIDLLPPEERRRSLGDIGLERRR
jgi:molecular chaperone DnaK